MKKISVLVLGSVSLILTACGQSEPQSDGVITTVNHQRVVIRDEAKKKELCAQQYCEPNYLITEAFGRSHDPAPVPSPTPKPSVSPTPQPGWDTTDTYDYSRTKMNLKEAWEVTEGSPEVIVAIIDSGVDLTHPDLKDNLWTNPGELNGKANSDNDGNGYKNDLHGYDFYYGKGDPTDQTGHGTHVAGTIAALKNNLGVVGVAPNVKIMPLRFIGPGGSGSTNDAIDAIYYAIKMGAKVISASWGNSGYSSYLAQAVKDAQDAGVVFVAAAGNQGRNAANSPYYPGSYDGVVSVGASTAKDTLASYSNYSPNAVTIAAPGDQIYSTYLNNGYETLSGTSMAAPQVSGAIALALSKNKSVTPDQVKSVLCQSADPILQNSVKCGRINVGRLVKSL
jgi:subtilisin family serine protease